VTDDLQAFSKVAKHKRDAKGTVGILVMRSYLLADNRAHYDAVIASLEGRGLNVITAYASGLDARPAVEQFFMEDGKASVDAVVSLTGFSLVGGPAYNDSAAAEELLATLDVPYLTAFASEFQSLDQWDNSDQGLTPVETTIMVAVPEMDGATNPILFGGRAKGSSNRDLSAHEERVDALAGRVEKLVNLRRKPRSERKIAAVIYDFPPNSGAAGSAAHLSVFRSLYNTLKGMKAEGYHVELPADCAELQKLILEGNSERFGTGANVAHSIETDTHVRREPHLAEIEAQWGPAPGRHQSDGSRIHVLGAHFGNVFGGVQPGFGYEGDPMRLLFEKGFAPTHAFAAFYSYLKHDLAADAVLHFGTHGALEFMPGKQVGMSDRCWPERLIGNLPNIYLYAANNPSEGTIARRRSGATLISYLTPPVAHAGLYKGLLDLRSTIDRYRGLLDLNSDEAQQLAEAIYQQAETLELLDDNMRSLDMPSAVARISDALSEFEQTLIPHGLHIVGEPPKLEERRDLLNAVNEASGDNAVSAEEIEALVAEKGVEFAEGAIGRLQKLNQALQQDHEIPALIHALDGGYIRPVSGGDVVRSPEIVPTGRNLHGFDPFRLPSAYAVEDGARQAARLLQRFEADNGRFPQRLAMVLWGTDNLKSEGSPIGQVLALMGAKPRFDSYGRLAGADLISLEELGRPRVDVVVTLSGIFRDLLPLQVKLLAEAASKAAHADEPLDMNPIRAHALQQMEREGCTLEDAALRVFSNAAGSYGSNVNMLIDSSAWDEADEIADTYTSRKSFAYGADGKPVKRTELLNAILAETECAYQNVESVELGVTSIDHYFDTLGGISRAISKSGGGDVTVYVGDQTMGEGKVRTLNEQVALETRTRMLNPKWYEALLDHGYEGVRQIEHHISNTMGWSATTGQVSPWVYKDLTETFVLDAEMRRRMAELNPKASSKLANRLIEASERNYWTPDDETLAALTDASEELEDRVEGIIPEAVSMASTARTIA
jgi:magnesium chelatase subunit H